MPSEVLVMPFSEGRAINTIARGNGGRMESTAAEGVGRHQRGAPASAAGDTMDARRLDGFRQLIAGRTVARRRASLGVPAPGGPRSRRFWTQNLHHGQLRRRR
jgi:hypothetical protein